MGLVQGYESESSDDGSSVAVPKRSLKTSKAELKSKRLRRNGKGPWAKWQGSSDDEIEQLSKDSNASNSLDLGGDEDAVASQSLERTKFVGSTEKTIWEDAFYTPQ